MQAFFQRWWREQSEGTQNTVRRLVNNGQLELMYKTCNVFGISYSLQL